MKFRKAKDFSGISIGKRKSLSLRAKDNGVNLGFANSSLIETVPNFDSTSAEKVIKNENNAWIVLGRDRPHDKLSGYGGRGDTHSSAIDIVVGRLGSKAKEVDENNQQVFVDNNFTYDAARIYISQKTDIDKNFDLADGSIGSSTTRSAIAIKADSVRVISREGIKIVTGVDKENSQGGSISFVEGIDLIAGNDDRDLQPLVKGDNLTSALERIVKHVSNLTGLVETFAGTQMKINAALMKHTHIGNLGAPTTPSLDFIPSGIINTLNHTLQTMTQLPLHRTNLSNFEYLYLNPVGKKYINSRHNNTN